MNPAYSFIRFMLYCLIGFLLTVAFVCMMISVLCEMHLRRDRSITRRHLSAISRVVNGR